MNQKKRELISKLAATNDYGEKLGLVAQLEQVEAEERREIEASRDLDWANMVIKERLSPVMAYDRHTTESDWLGGFTASAHSPHQIYAEASQWFDSLDSDVKSDAEEFIIQAKGHARRVTGSLGHEAEIGEQEFMDYVAFLNREVLAASGLDQIAQEYDPKDEYKPTPYPTEVFDNFAPETNEHATTTPRGSDQAPSIREMTNAPGSQDQARPSRHDTGDVKLDDAPNDNYPETKTSPGTESGEPSRHMTSSREGDAANFTGDIELPSVSGASRGTGWWKNFRDKLKGRPKGKHRMEKGKHREEDAPQHEPEHVKEPGGQHRAPKPSPGKHRSDSAPAPHKPNEGQKPSGTDRRHRTQPSRNQPGGKHRGEGKDAPSAPGRHRAPGKHRKPETINHGDKSGPRPKTRPGGQHRGDPLSDPSHKVKDTGTPIHDRARRAKDPTPTHDKIKQEKSTDDHIRRELDRRQKGEPSSVREIKNPGDRKNMTQQTHKPTFSHANLRPSEAASGLDQIQQVTDVHDQAAPRPMPEEVAFPMREDWKEESTENMDIQTNERKAMLEMAHKLAAQAEALIKQADMWGNSDSPRPTPGPAVENSPHTTPNEGTGQSYESGYNAGARDKMVGDAPTYSDASSGVPEYARGYSKGYSEEEGPTRPKTVPSSMGGDNGQALNSDRIQRRKEMPLSMGSFQASGVFTEESALESPDFRKGYAYARKWTSEVPLVRVGSADFEAGIYAGITDNPENQRDFVSASLSHEELHPRISTHRDFTQQMWSDDDSLTVKGSYVQAATTTDLNMNSPTVSPDPYGATPQQGPGNPPPHDGMENPARPGGPAPYNGVEPLGQPVVPNPVMGPDQEDNPRLASFRARVQASLEEERNQV